jgi:hypothetical protein
MKLAEDLTLWRVANQTPPRVLRAAQHRDRHMQIFGLNYG